MSNDGIQILKMSDCIDEMLYDLENGQEKGSTTHIPLVDNCWKWRLSEVNIWTGFLNEGKSLNIRYLSIIKAITDGWKFILSAPEDWPAKTFFDDCIHTLSGQSTDRDNPNFIGRERYIAAYKILEPYFFFAYVKPPENTVARVLDIMEPEIVKHGIKGVIIDPIIKHARPKDVGERDDIYAAYLTSLLTDFSRRTNTSVHMVMHQLTPKINDKGLYPKPSAYTIKGGGTWSDGVDNVLFIHRDNYALDKMDTLVTFGSQKIKKHKLNAIPQELKMRFDRKTNRYTNEDGSPLFNFDKYFPPVIPKERVGNLPF